MDKIKYIAWQLSEEEILCQIAEEASELAHAALKLRRAMRNENPTPVKQGEAMIHLLEEVGDVQLSVDALKVKLYGEETEIADVIVEDLMDMKKRRWVSRLKGARNDENKNDDNR